MFWKSLPLSSCILSKLRPVQRLPGVHLVLFARVEESLSLSEHVCYGVASLEQCARVWRCRIKRQGWLLKDLGRYNADTVSRRSKRGRYLSWWYGKVHKRMVHEGIIYPLLESILMDMNVHWPPLTFRDIIVGFHWTSVRFPSKLNGNHKFHNTLRVSHWNSQCQSWFDASGISSAQCQPL